MILTDNDIEKLVSEGKLISKGFSKQHLKGIAYELTISGIIDANGKEISTYTIEPGMTVYVKSNEQLSLPENVAGRVIERNSVMRSGLKVDAPEYIPGHTTFAFLRVQNISASSFTLVKDFAIAQIMFEQLSGIPSQTYDRQENAAFTDEAEYRGLGRYASEYEKLSVSMKNAKDDLEDLKGKIYGNVLTLMGILVAVFSFITVDFNILSKTSELKTIVTVNLSLALSISVLMSIVLFFVNGIKKKKTALLYVGLVAVIAIATIISVVL